MATTILRENAAMYAMRDESKIRELLESIYRAHHDKNAIGITSPYAEDAAVFNLAPPLAHCGRDREEVQAWLDTWATPIEISARDLEITVTGDFAFAHGFLHMQGTKKGADSPLDFWMRETVCLERRRGSWLIVHEHTSVPFYMDGTTRPAFDLKP
ncbi:MAG TPA: nuclear transport factor 2 family protein [Terracidiphilus sp.]|nr:nuclear transport factor 2 family protein [Terracidiphilus sp.]